MTLIWVRRLITDKILILYYVIIFGFSTELHVQLTDFVKSQNQEFYDTRDDDLVEQLKQNKIDIDKLIRNTERQYKEEILEYADRVGPTDEEIFAQSFHRYELCSVKDL